MESFATIAKGFQSLKIVVKSSFLDVYGGSDCVFIHGLNTRAYNLELSLIRKYLLLGNDYEQRQSPRGVLSKR